MRRAAIPAVKSVAAAGELGGEPRFDHLVQRAAGEAASRQVTIKATNTKRQGLDLVRSTFQPGDPVP